MGPNFSSLEYGNCRDLTRFTHVKVNFEKKNAILPIEKFPSLVLPRNVIMLQHLINHFSLHYPSSSLLREVKTKGKIQSFSSKSGRGRLREVVACKRFQI